MADIAFSPGTMITSTWLNDINTLYNRAGASLTGESSRTALSKFADWASVIDYGADPTGSVDSRAAFSNALTNNLFVIVPAGTYKITNTSTPITMSRQYNTLWLQGGANVSLDSATSTGILITADDCNVHGPGRITSPASWDGTNARRTFAVVRVQSANRCTIENVYLNNIPRCGIQFEDSTNGVIRDNILIGNFPQATYDGSSSTLTGHAAVDYNPPSTVSTNQSSLLIIGNRIESSVQGVLIGNFDSSASESGILVSNNRFNRCWDHGVYSTLAESINVSTNTFLNCKAPIVVDGNGPVVSSNTLYATDTGSNGFQLISVRDADNAIIENNTIYGLGAAIALDCISGTTLRRNRVANNVIHRTGAGLASFGIRLGLNAQILEHNVIENNTIYGGNFDANTGAIQVEMAPTFYGVATKIKGNTVVCTSVNPGINVSNQQYCVIEDNDLYFSGSTGSARTVSLIYGIDYTNSMIRNNNVHYLSGGTNVTARGIQIDTASTGTAIEENKFFLFSSSLVATDPLGTAGLNSYFKDNQHVGTTALTGTATLLSGTASIAVSNANCRAGSTILVIPNNNNAGTLMNSKGYYVTASAGSFTIFTGDGLNAAADCNFKYIIH